MKTTWKDLGIKEKLAMISACAAFCMGWTLTALASFVPLLISEKGILWILGQSLIYSASVFGISAYFKSETVQLKRDMDKHLERMERMEIQRIRLAKGEDVDEIPDEE
jgi:hypothetical protein